MKICFFEADITSKGGIERVLSTLTNKLLIQDPNIEITILSQCKSFALPNYPFHRDVKIEYLRDAKFSGSPKSFRRLLSHLGNIRRVHSYFTKHEFDIISSQSFTNTFLLWVSNIPFNKVVCVEHVFYGYYNWLLRIIRLFIYRKLRFLSVLTTIDQQYYSKYFSNVVLIPNPIDTFSNYRSTLTEKRIISIGRLETQKNFDRLLVMMAKLLPDNPEWCLHIYGEGTLESVLKKQIKDLGLSKQVLLKGTTDNIDEVLSRYSFLVMPSKYEGFGMVLVEALKNGLPCISYDCPAGPADIIQHGVNGLLVPNQDETEMIHSIQKLMLDESYRIYLGSNAPSSIQKFDAANIAQKWLSLYHTMLSTS